MKIDNRVLQQQFRSSTYRRLEATEKVQEGERVSQVMITCKGNKKSEVGVRQIFDINVC